MASAQEARRALGDDLRVVAQVLDLDLALVEVVVAVVVDLREVVEPAGEVAEEAVPAEPRRAEPGQVAAVPLADQRGLVAAPLQLRGERGMVERYAVDRRRRADRLSQAAFEPARIAAGVEAEARRRADGRGRVAVGEAHAGGGEPVDVGRSDLRRAVAGEVGPAEVVGEDHEQVRLRQSSAAVVARLERPLVVGVGRRPGRRHRGRHPGAGGADQAGEAAAEMPGAVSAPGSRAGSKSSLSGMSTLFPPAFHMKPVGISVFAGRCSPVPSGRARSATSSRSRSGCGAAG